MRILLIENDPVDARICRRSLIDAGVEPQDIEVVGTLAAGLECAAPSNIDLVLLDLGLPDSNGLDTLFKFCKLRPDLPVVILTGFEDKKQALAAVEGGAQDYLIKGKFDSEVLYRSLRYAITRHRLLREHAMALASAKKNAEELRVSQSRYRRLTECGIIGIIHATIHGTIFDANDEFLNTIGRQQSDLPIEWEAISCAERSYEDQHAVASLMEHGIVEPWETEFVRPDKSRVPVLVGAARLDEEHDLCICFVLNLSDRRRAEHERSRRLTAEHDLGQTEKKISLARQVQQCLISSKAPSIPGLDISGSVFVADRASGDFFDYIELPHSNLGIVVADVSGHGLGPAFVAAQTQAYVQALARSEFSVNKIVASTNELVCRHDAGHLVTLFLAKLDPESRQLFFMGAGHMAYLLRAGGQVEQLEPKMLPLGVATLPDLPETQCVQLEPEDLFILPTDGIQEAQTRGGELFGIDRLMNIVRWNRHRSAKEIVHALYHASRQFTQGAVQMDDMTVVIVRVLEQ